MGPKKRYFNNVAWAPRPCFFLNCTGGAPVPRNLGALCLLLLFFGANRSLALPYHQEKEPGPALSPQEALDHLKLPPGFKATLVASEPDIVNPTSFTFDDSRPPCCMLACDADVLVFAGAE